MAYSYESLSIVLGESMWFHPQVEVRASGCTTNASDSSGFRVEERYPSLCERLALELY